MNDLAVIRNALLMPFQGTEDAFVSGVFDRGVCLEDSLMSRGGAAAPVFPSVRLAGVYIFGGYLFGRYGLFLVESLSRVHAVKRCPNFPLLFMSPGTQVSAWQQQVFQLLGVSNQILLVQQPTEVERLILPPPGASLCPPFFRREQLAALQADVAPAAAEDSKLWLSRSRWKTGGVVNEDVVESRLAALGWELFHPEEHPPAAQVRSLSTARCVAGFAGSAFLTAAMAEKVPGRVIVFSRCGDIPAVLPRLYAEKGILLEEHTLPVDHLGGKGALARCLLREPENVAEILREAG